MEEGGQDTMASLFLSDGGLLFLLLLLGEAIQSDFGAWLTIWKRTKQLALTLDKMGVTQPRDSCHPCVCRVQEEGERRDPSIFVSRGTICQPGMVAQHIPSMTDHLA